MQGAGFMPIVKITNGPLKDRTFTVENEPLIIGREPTCAIHIMDKGASRQHAEVFRIGEMCFIRDLESRNGILLNDNRVKEEMLREGDRIQIGATILGFSNSATPVDFTDEDESLSTLELKLEDLNDPTATGDGGDVKRLRALYRVGRMIGNVSDEKELIEKILPFVCEQLGAAVAYLFTRNQENGAITPIGSHLVEANEAGKISRSIIKRAIVEKRAILTTDAMNDGRFKATESIVIKGIRSVICAPLSVSGAISGVLYLSHTQQNKKFTDDELELCAAMADQIGLALANFRNRIKLRENMTSTIRALVRTMEVHDPETKGKSERVSRYAGLIAQGLRLSAEMQYNLQMAGLLHNIGILADNSWTTTSKNSRSAESLIKRVNATLEIIKEIDSYSQIEKPLRFMFERADGSGPEKITDIPASAQVLGLAIDFDELANKPISEKSEKECWREAVAEIGRQAGRRYDEAAVRALLVALREGTLQT